MNLLWINVYTDYSDKVAIRDIKAAHKPRESIIYIQVFYRVLLFF